MSKDTIYRQEAIRLITGYNGVMDKSVAKRLLIQMPSAQPRSTMGQVNDTAQSTNDCISRQAAINALHGLAHRFEDSEDWCILEGEAEFVVSKLPTAEPEIMPDGTLHITATVDVANINRILLSQKGTHLGALYYKDE